MKKGLMMSLILAFALCAAGCGGGSETEGQAPEQQLPDGSANVLVTYFSWSAAGNTQRMAGYIAEATGGELYRLIPETPYSTVYNEVTALAQDELREGARPAIADTLTAEQMEGYDVIFIGYPIWWGDAPMIIYTFIESHDFTGKTVIPFATSGGSGMATSVSNITAACTGARMLSGLLLGSSNVSRDRVNTWVDGLELTTNE